MIRWDILSVFYVYLLIGFTFFMLFYQIANEKLGKHTKEALPLVVVFIYSFILWLPYSIALIIKYIVESKKKD